MRRARSVHGVLGVLLATGGLATTGCTHNYYYTTPVAGPCAPTAVIPGPPSTSSVVQSYGEVCEVPTQVVGGGTVVAGVPFTSTPVLGGARPPRVVLSDPVGRGRGPWKRMDAESSLATTRVEGAIDESTLTR